MKYYIVPDPNESKFDRIKRRVKEGVHNTGDWINRNKEMIIFVAPIVIGGVSTIVKATTKTANLHKEEKLKNLYCYDPSLGHYWSLKRKLSNREWVEIDNRRAAGERMADILNQLNVLKK